MNQALQVYHVLFLDSGKGNVQEQDGAEASRHWWGAGKAAITERQEVLVRDKEDDRG